VFPGVALAGQGMENVMGGIFVSQGQTLEIRGWKFELSILKDPNGLLTNSEWPLVSFGLKPDNISIPPEPSNSVSVPEPSLLLQVGHVETEDRARHAAPTLAAMVGLPIFAEGTKTRRRTLRLTISRKQRGLKT
jgi:hypothetical protein